MAVRNTIMDFTWLTLGAEVSRVVRNFWYSSQVSATIFSRKSALAGQHVAFADLVPLGDEFLEGLEVDLGLAVQPHQGEDGGRCSPASRG